MTNNAESDNGSKGFRILPFVGGILALYVSFFALIPLGLFAPLFGTSLTDLSIEILVIDDLYFFIWGITDGVTMATDFSTFTLESLFPMLIWIIMVSAGILGLVGSAYNEDPKKIKKKIKLAALFIIIVIIFYVSLYIFYYLDDSSVVIIGFGFYILCLIVPFYILGAHRITDYHEIE
ncbi:MAG: hypothetical protein GF364_04920 [Candidatus Lokiarchaeota archaeon]|nr:hypothetical protein [Candidatus Lokiarchaeota archaeon]